MKTKVQSTWILRVNNKQPTTCNSFLFYDPLLTTTFSKATSTQVNTPLNKWLQSICDNIQIINFLYAISNATQMQLGRSSPMHIGYGDQGRAYPPVQDMPRRCRAPPTEPLPSLRSPQHNNCILYRCNRKSCSGATKKIPRYSFRIIFSGGSQRGASLKINF